MERIHDNRLRTARARAGLSQQAAARAVGLTRQSLSAIEAGRSTPSVAIALRLARVLGARVEDLFALEPAQLDVLVPAPIGPGRVAAAQVGGRWVAHSLEPHDAARSADAVAGKASRAGVPLTLLRSPEQARDVVLLMGCAPALGALAERLGSLPGPGWFRWLPRSSSVALDELFAERTHIAGMHWSGTRGDANLAELRRRCAAHRSSDLRVVTLAHWEVGLVVAKGNPHRIGSAGDLARPRLRLVLREAGSGASRMLARELKAAGQAHALEGRAAIRASGHLEVAAAVAIGAADVGPATRDAARAHDLGFVALAEERFDLVLAAEMLGDPRVVRLLDELSSGAWRRELGELGYDTQHTGDVVAQVRAA